MTAIPRRLGIVLMFLHQTFARRFVLNSITRLGEEKHFEFVVLAEYKNPVSNFSTLSPTFTVLSRTQPANVADPKLKKQPKTNLPPQHFLFVVLLLRNKLFMDAQGLY